MSQELDEFVDANTVSRLIGNPLMSDLCLRLCVLWTLGDPGVADALQWFVDCPDPNWGAQKVSSRIAIIKKAASVEATAVADSVDRVFGIRVHTDALRNATTTTQQPQEQPSRLGSGRFQSLILYCIM